MCVTRQECKQRFEEVLSKGGVIIGAGAGTGLSAKCAEMGGVDLIIIYNSGRYRMAGRGSASGMMPYGNANHIVLEMANEVLPVVHDTPVLAGVCGTDPFINMDYFLKELLSLGFSGVQNFPTVGVIDGFFRQTLEETGLSYSLEVDMIAKASDLGLLTAPYVFNEEEAKDMAKANADLLVAHMLTTAKGSIGARTTMTLDDAVTNIQRIHDAAKSVNPDIWVLCHGGPIAEPKDVEYVLRNTKGISGFFGASSIERLPTEKAIAERVRAFKQLKADRTKA
jgi:predicted TIM-barrel enzyme